MLENVFDNQENSWKNDFCILSSLATAFKPCLML